MLQILFLMTSQQVQTISVLHLFMSGGSQVSIRHSLHALQSRAVHLQFFLVTRIIFNYLSKAADFVLWAIWVSTRTKLVECIWPVWTPSMLFIDNVCSLNDRIYYLKLQGHTLYSPKNRRLLCFFFDWF